MSYQQSVDYRAHEELMRIGARDLHWAPPSHGIGLWAVVNGRQEISDLDDEDAIEALRCIPRGADEAEAWAIIRAFEKGMAAQRARAAAQV